MVSEITLGTPNAGIY